MAITVNFQPDANLLGGAAYNAGAGLAAQRMQELLEGRNRMMLGAALQDRAQKMDYTLGAAEMVNRQRANQQAMWLDMQQRAWQNSQAAQQQAWQQGLQTVEMQNRYNFQAAVAQQEMEQQAEMQRMTLAANLIQDQFQMELRDRSQASQAYNQLMARRQALEQSYRDGYLNDAELQELMSGLNQEIAGFDVKQFPRDSPYPQGQGIGEMWDGEFEIPGVGALPVRYTRDQHGVPQLTRESEIMLENELKKKEAAQPKPIMDFKQFVDSFGALLEGTQQVIVDPATGQESYTPPNIQEAMQQMAVMLQAWNQMFGQPAMQQAAQIDSQQPGMQGMGGPPGQMPQPPMPQQPNGQPQAKQPDFPFKEAREVFRFVDNPPPPEFAKRVLQQNPTFVFNYLTSKYGDNVEAVLAGGNPDDIAMVLVAWPKKGKKKKSSPPLTDQGMYGAGGMFMGM